MRSHKNLYRNIFIVVLVLLLPILIFIWLSIYNVLDRASNEEKQRLNTSLVSQTDRLVMDLDSELGLLDSYIISKLKEPDIDEELLIPVFGKYITELQNTLRWPDLVNGIYLVKPTLSKEVDVICLLSPKDQYNFIPEVKKHLYGVFEEPFVIPHDKNDNSFLTRTITTNLTNDGQTQKNIIVTIINQNVLAQKALPELAEYYFGKDSGFEDYSLQVKDANNIVRFADSEYRSNHPDFARNLLRHDGLVPEPFIHNAEELGIITKDNDIDMQVGKIITERKMPPPAKKKLELIPPMQREGNKHPPLDDNWMLDISLEGNSMSLLFKENKNRWAVAVGLVFALMYLSIIVMALAITRVKELASREKTFIASVTHELKTPVAVARSAGENLAKGIVPINRVPEYGNIVATEAKRLGSSIEKLLLMSGLESNRIMKNRGAVDLNEVVESEIKRLIHHSEKNGAQFNVQTIDEAIVDIPRPMLESALDSVFTNAIKYAGGTINITIQKSYKKSHELILVKCQDSGPGIPRSERRHIFEPFYRGEKVVDQGIQGTGIGLYLARRITRLFGGDFIMRFPVEGGTIAELSFRSYI